MIKYIKSQNDWMRYLDLSSTDLRQTDLTYLMREISDPSSGIRLHTLNLSENRTVDDEVIKQVCDMFKKNMSIQHFYCDKTGVTLKGLRRVLKAIQGRRNFRTISVKENDLSMIGKDGERIVDLLKNNLSLTEFSYHHNFFDVQFDEAVKVEI